MSMTRDKDIPRATFKDYLIGFLISLLVPFGALAFIYGLLNLIT